MKTCGGYWPSFGGDETSVKPSNESPAERRADGSLSEPGSPTPRLLTSCPACGRSRRAGAVRGLCPRCLLEVVLDEPMAENPASDILLPNRPVRFGEYELEGELGRGGAGVVYRARQPFLNRTVALKMLLPARLASTTQLERFRLEAEAVAGLDHPSLLPVFEFGEIQGQPYFTMKLADGGSLADRIARGRAFSEEEAARIVVAISRAVHYAHQRGIQHRDLKPANILLDAAGRPYVSDFGIAKFRAHEANLTVTSDLLGSPAYLAPEQTTGADRNITIEADIYGLGAILYECLTGRPPFESDNLAGLLRMIAEEDPVAPGVIRPGLDRDLEIICLKCLQKSPANRHANAEELAAELDRWLKGEPIRSRPITFGETIYRWGRRNPTLAATLMALALAVVGGATGVTVQWRRATAHFRQQRLERYAADLQVASQALASHDLGLARRMVSAQLPHPGEEDLRGFEWRLLQRLCEGQNALTLTGHTATVTCLAYFPDGKRLVSGGLDGSVMVWDALTGAQLLKIATSREPVWSVAVSLQADRIISAGSDGRVQFWTLDGKPAQRPLPGINAALSADGVRLAVSASPPFKYFASAPGLTVWDWRSGKVVFSTNLTVRRVALSARGDCLAAAGDTQDVLLWNLNSGERRRLMTPDAAWALSINQDGTQIAAAGFGIGARVWDLQSTNAPRLLTGHSYNVWGVSFSPDDRRLATSGSDRTVQLRDVDQGSGPSAILDGHDDEVWAVTWAPDGQSLATGGKDRTVRTWPAAPKPQGVEAPNASYLRPRFSMDGSQLLAAEIGDDGAWRVALRNAKNGSLLAKFNGRALGTFAADNGDIVLLDDESSAFERWSPKTRAARRIPLMTRAKPEATLDADFSPDGSAVVLADKHAVTVWRTADGIPLTAPLPRPGSGKIVCALSAKGRRLAVSAETPYEVVVYDLKGKGGILTLKKYTEFVKGLAFSRDGKFLASASVDRFVRVWNAENGALIGELLRHVEEATDVAFAPDDQTLASIGYRQSVKLWHLPTMREVVSIELPDAGEHVVFSPRGDTFAITTSIDTVRLISVEPLTQQNRRNR